MVFVPVPGTEVMFSKYETRVAEFQRFFEAMTNTVPPADLWSRYERVPQTAAMPVVGVKWTTATNFCFWLTALERQAANPIYRLSTNQSYRLPTDEEWSWAMGLTNEMENTPAKRGQSTATRGIYPWGTNLPPSRGAGNYAGQERRRGFGSAGTIQGYRDDFPDLAPAGRFRPNRFGLYDMGGNVAEWCETPFDREEKPERTVRDASYLDDEKDRLRSAYRDGLSQGTPRHTVGFRIVLEFEPRKGPESPTR
jgi:formylglycine-generating enzyme required for sulfatase activity